MVDFEEKVSILCRNCTIFSEKCSKFRPKMENFASKSDENLIAVETCSKSSIQNHEKSWDSRVLALGIWKDKTYYCFVVI